MISPWILLLKGTFSAPVAPLVKGQMRQCSSHASILRRPCACYTRTLFTRCRLQCVTVINIHYQRFPETDQFITAKISGNALKQESRTHSVLRQRSSQLQKHKTARMSRRIAVDQNVCGWGWRTLGVDSLKFVNYTIIEHAHKVRKKIFILSCGCYMYN